MHGSINGLREFADPGVTADFRLGDALIRPRSREIEGPGGGAMIEPRVMKVLLALADARGAVVSRDDLMQRCWAGQFVGDDALNRTIGEIRRLARVTASDGFGIETIPRTGYRLTGAVPEPVAEPATSVAAEGPVTTRPLSRRAVIGGAAFAAATLTAIAAWRSSPGADEARVAALIEQGAQAMRDGLPASDAQGVGFLREAVALAPGNAAAWGKLALAHKRALDDAMPDAATAIVRDCETAARRALVLDPRQSDALAALALLPPMFGDWLAAERRLRAVIAVDPANLAAMSGLAGMLMSVGRHRESGQLSLRVAESEPLSPVNQYRRAYAQWNAGRPGDAERTLDRALQLWPRHPGVWNTRLLLLAFTDRPATALALLGDATTRPVGLPDPHLERLQTGLRALISRAPTDVTATIAAWRAPPLGPVQAVNAIMYLAKLGALDDAFAVAEGYLLRRGTVVVGLERTADQPSINDQRWRKTMMLFLGAMTELRADRRFLPLCRDMGLVDYWRASGTTPDFLRARPLTG